MCALLKEYTAFITILSGSLVLYAPRVDGGALVAEVVSDSAYEVPEYMLEAAFVRGGAEDLGIS